MNQIKKLSIVTVCFNAEKTISETFDSVLAQSNFNDMELIIIDGKSTDCTNKIIESYLPKFAQENIPIVYVSEKDSGVYDAMNKATSLARGEWMIFMNADDCFEDKDVLHDIFCSYDISAADVVFGDTVIRVNNHDRKVLKAQKEKYLKVYKPFVHQSCFVRRELQSRYPFDLKYKISADYDFFLNLYLNKYKFKRVMRTIAVFSENGMSCDIANEKLIRKENKEIARSYGINYFNTPSLFWYRQIKPMFQKLKRKLIKN